MFSRSYAKISQWQLCGFGFQGVSWKTVLKHSVTQSFAGFRKVSQRGAIWFKVVQRYKKWKYGSLAWINNSFLLDLVIQQFYLS
ncbi:hypothetical protein DXU93_08095 [Brumimicrobium aurantiacum]|uniref:Uncharacterized protein n=1 Tax=Brumimicrobium aurantiacum TaxID=1737063 RepID=A0A3E1EXW2_9FLAO|nr:hypothetical protein DXU93_08095 [Brumimicrobium aurantiacum]